MYFWQQLKNVTAQKALMLMLVAGSHLGSANAQTNATQNNGNTEPDTSEDVRGQLIEINPDSELKEANTTTQYIDYINNAGDTTKTLPDYAMPLDQAHEQTAASGTTDSREFIDETMMIRGYLTNPTNNLTKIAAEDLIVRMSSKYGSYLNAARGDMDVAIANLRKETELSEQSTPDDVARATEIYQDLAKLHHGDLKRNGTFDMVRNNFDKLTGIWHTHSLLDNYLPSTYITKQLGHTTVLDNEALALDDVDMENVLTVISMHIGPTGAKRLINSALVENKGDHKLSTLIPQSWVNVLVDKTIAIPYDDIPQDEIEKIKEQITFNDLTKALTTRPVQPKQEPPLALTPQTPPPRIEIADSVPPVQERAPININISQQTYSSNEYMEEVYGISAVSAFAGFEQEYAARGKGDYLGFSNDRDHVTHNNFHTGIRSRITDTQKEAEEGREAFVHGFSELSVGLGSANVNIDATPEEKQHAADRFTDSGSEVAPEYFDDYSNFKTNFISISAEAGIAVGPVYYSFSIDSYNLTDFNSLSTGQAYALRPNSLTGTHTLGANLVNIGIGESTLTLDGYVQGSDVNMFTRNRGVLQNDGSVSGSSQHQALTNSQDIPVLYANKALPASIGSWNTFGLEAHYAMPDNGLGFYAGVEINGYNGHGGGGAVPWIKQSVQNMVIPKNWSNPYVSIGITYQWGGDKTRKIEQEFSQQSTVSTTGNIPYELKEQSRYGSDETSSQPYIRPRALINF